MPSQACQTHLRNLHLGLLWWEDLGPPSLCPARLRVWCPSRRSAATVAPLSMWETRSLSQNQASFWFYTLYAQKYTWNCFSECVACLLLKVYFVDLLYRNNWGCSREPSTSSPSCQCGFPTQPRKGGLQEAGTDQTGPGCTHPERGAGLPEPVPRATQHQVLSEELFHVSS